MNNSHQQKLSGAAMLEELEDAELVKIIISRIGDKEIKVDINDL